MEKIKGILEGLLYLVVIYLSQKIINDLFGNMVFYLSSQENSIVSKMFFSKTISVEEKALTIIYQTQPICIMIAWIVGIGIIVLTLKASSQEVFPSFKEKIGFGNILLSIIIGLGMVFLTNGFIYGILQYFSESLTKRSLNTFDESLLNVLIVVITIPFLEEVVFRGFIMGKLYKVGSMWFAIIIQSILFSLSHMDVFQGISVFILSIGIGYVVIKTNSILSGVIIHSIFNITNIYLSHTNDPFLDLGQMVIFIVIGLFLTYFGIDRLRETTYTIS